MDTLAGNINAWLRTTKRADLPTLDEVEKEVSKLLSALEISYTSIAITNKVVTVVTSFTGAALLSYDQESILDALTKKFPTQIVKLKWVVT